MAQGVARAVGGQVPKAWRPSLRVTPSLTQGPSSILMGRAW